MKTGPLDERPSVPTEKPAVSVVLLLHTLNLNRFRDWCSFHWLIHVAAVERIGDVSEPRSRIAQRKVVTFKFSL